MQNKYVCIHTHNYQPLREDPWTGLVPKQDSAHPYHDWNERVTAECYTPNTQAKVLGNHNELLYSTNNYSKTSFNFGYTLLDWLEKNCPTTYEKILEADWLSSQNFGGHGSAVAQIYHHIIMPLASDKDKYAQVQLSVNDFIARFKRYPEGMWLSETAVDTKTLECLADFNFKYTILSPYQAHEVKSLNAPYWQDVSGGHIDPTRPYMVRLPSGKSIAIFFYDKYIAQDVAFNGLLNNGERFAHRLMSAFHKGDSLQLSHIATDGESYGHHHKLGEMALAYCIKTIEQNPGVRLTNYGEFLEKCVPQHEVRIFENSSWSCSHGIERWRSNCGCNCGSGKNWNQEWRAPLREALNWLRQQVEGITTKIPEKECITDWYINELQKYFQLMYTSCGWFFDEVSGLETVQNLKYALKVMEIYYSVTNINLEPEFLKILSKAKSNIKEFGNGADVYRRFAKEEKI